MNIPYPLSPQEVASALVKLTAPHLKVTTDRSGDRDDDLSEHSSDVLHTVHWGSRISCGALPCCVPVLGDLMSFFEPNDSPGVIRAHINNRAHFLLHKKRTHNFPGLLHVSVASSRLVTQRSGDCFQFSVMNHSEQVSEPMVLRSSYEMLKREVVLWITRIATSNVGKTKPIKLAEIESQFPFLMLLSPAQRVNYLMQAIHTYAHGTIIWFDKTAIVETGVPTFFCAELGTKGERRGVSALRLALDNASVLGDYARIEKLCHALRVILEMHLKSPNVVIPPHLLRCVGIAFQVMIPFLNASLRISEMSPLPVMGQLDLILDYCGTGDVDKLTEFSDIKKKSQKRRTGWLPFLVSVVQRASCHRRCFYVDRESSVRPKQPLMDNASTFFASVLPSDPQQTPNTLTIDGNSLRSSLIDQWNGNTIPEVSLFKGNKLMDLQKKVLSELVFSVHQPAHLLLSNISSTQDNDELKLFIGKRSRHSEENIFDEKESYTLDIIRQGAFSKRYRRK
ncbi:unnamed protein product [Phytomonas sp. Hart1]|nr:unnamed protein product [Phytomonas sp. Hart1]|eukprot:CCW70238.1 unnamed protein product [Phytomonas sp. isolate Hart1]